MHEYVLVRLLTLIVFRLCSDGADSLIATSLLDGVGISYHDSNTMLLCLKLFLRFSFRTLVVSCMQHPGDLS